jgi:hypothetical protein
MVEFYRSRTSCDLGCPVVIAERNYGRKGPQPLVVSVGKENDGRTNSLTAIRATVKISRPRLEDHHESCGRLWRMIGTTGPRQDSRSSLGVSTSHRL